MYSLEPPFATALSHGQRLINVAVEGGRNNISENRNTKGTKQKILFFLKYFSSR